MKNQNSSRMFYVLWDGMNAKFSILSMGPLSERNKDSLQDEGHRNAFWLSAVYQPFIFQFLFIKFDWLQVVFTLSSILFKLPLLLFPPLEELTFGLETLVTAADPFPILFTETGPGLLLEIFLGDNCWGKELRLRTTF